MSPLRPEVMHHVFFVTLNAKELRATPSGLLLLKACMMTRTCTFAKVRTNQVDHNQVTLHCNLLRARARVGPGRYTVEGSSGRSVRAVFLVCISHTNQLGHVFYPMVHLGCMALGSLTTPQHTLSWFAVSKLWKGQWAASKGVLSSGIVDVGWRGAPCSCCAAFNVIAVEHAWCWIALPYFPRLTFPSMQSIVLPNAVRSW